MTTDKPIGAELRAALLPAAEPLFADDLPFADKVSRMLKYLGDEVERLSAENQKLRLSLMLFGDERFEN